MRYRRTTMIKLAAGVSLTFLVGFGYSAFLHRPRIVCQISPWLHPTPRDIIRSSDFLEERVLPGYSPFHRFVIRIWGDGQVDRRDADCPLDFKDQHTRVDPREARLLISAGQVGLCRMCSFYGPPSGVMVLDAGDSRMTVSTESLTKTVTDSAGEPDSVYRQLTNRAERLSGILELVDTSHFSSQRKAFCEKVRQETNARDPWPAPALP